MGSFGWVRLGELVWVGSFRWVRLGGLKGIDGIKIVTRFCSLSLQVSGQSSAEDGAARGHAAPRCSLTKKLPTDKTYDTKSSSATHL